MGSIDTQEEPVVSGSRLNMRATEALWLSDPKTELNRENLDICTHLDVERHREEIKLARRENRRPKSLFE